MNEHSKHNTVSAPPQVELDVMALIKRMQQQLGFLEKKIDILISQSSERSFKGKSFSRPFRPMPARPAGFSPSHRYGKGEHDHSPRQGGFVPGRPFDQPQGNENRGFGQKKRPFFRQRKDRGQGVR